MSTTALFFLPLQPNAPSPTSSIITHIARNHSTQSLPPYHLDHRLFIDTSSLLPNTDPSTRRYTHILTTSHSPNQTFIGTSAPSSTSTSAPDPPNTNPSTSTTTPPSTPLSLLTIPLSQADNLTALLTTKLLPHWSFRQHLTLSASTGDSSSIAISLQPALPWTIRIGDLRTSTRSFPDAAAVSQAVGGGAAGNLRGTVCEITCHDSGMISLDEGASELEKEGAERVFRGFLEALVKASGLDAGLGMGVEGWRCVLGKSNRSRRVKVEIENGVDGDEAGGDKDVKGRVTQETRTEIGEGEWEMARLYMSLLKGTRP